MVDHYIFCCATNIIKVQMVFPRISPELQIEKKRLGMTREALISYKFW